MFTSGTVAAHWRTALLAVSFVLTACKQTVEMRMDVNASPDPAVAHFFYNGFPTDLRQREDGSINLSDIPRGKDYLTRLYADSIEQEQLGYSPLLPIYVSFTGPLQRHLLPQQDQAYARPDAPIQVIDVDRKSPEYGRRFPLQVSMTWQADTYRPSHLLQVLPTPGIHLRPDTTYALIVTDAVPVSSEDTLRQHSQLKALLQPDSTPDNVSERARNVYAPLRAFLQQQKMDFTRVVGATVWTTADMTQWMKRGAQYVAALSPPLAENLYLADEYEDYCVIRGTFEVPGFQRGIVPYPLPAYGGDIQWHDDGTPIQQYTRQAPFVVTLPKHAPMPAAGFPMMLFNHGAGGKVDQVVARGAYIDGGGRVPGGGPAWVAAQRGWASASMGAHMAMDHLGPLAGGQGMWEYDLLNPVAMRNSYAQMAWEKILFRRFVRTLQLDPGLCPEAATNTDQRIFHFDPHTEVQMSQSLGNWAGTIQVALDPEPYQGVIFSGIAANWMRFFSDNLIKSQALETGMLALPPLEHFDQWHPFMLLVQWLESAADPGLYADTILRNPAKTAPHVLAISGQFDRSSSEWVQQVYAVALGVDLAGPELGVSADTRLLEYMETAGGRQWTYPVANNLMVPGQGARTAVVVRYLNTGRTNANGHNVTFEIDPPKHQYGCFLQDIAAGRAPVIIEGGAQNDPCFEPATN